MSKVNDLIKKGAAIKDKDQIVLYLKKCTSKDVALVSQEVFFQYINVPAYMCPKDIMIWRRG